MPVTVIPIVLWTAEIRGFEKSTEKMNCQISGKIPICIAAEISKFPASFVIWGQITLPLIMFGEWYQWLIVGQPLSLSVRARKQYGTSREIWVCIVCGTHMELSTIGIASKENDTPNHPDKNMWMSSTDMYSRIRTKLRPYFNNSKIIRRT